jgi:hypothetical protein
VAATSGLYLFAPEVAQLVSEAAERCGIDPASLDASHAAALRRCINFMFAAWTSKKFKQPWMTTYSVTLTQGQTSIPLVAPAVDVFHAYLTRSGYDVEMFPISRKDYEAIPNKTQQGRPTMYWVDYSSELNNLAPTVKIWQASQNATDVWNASVFNRMQDAGQSNNALGIPYTWYEAAAAGIAARFAQKYRPERYEMLKGESVTSFLDAMDSTREKASTRIRFRGRF